MDHLPKGDLKKIDELAETIIWITNLSREKKKIIDSKLKLIGSDLNRSLAELMEGPENFLKSDILLPDRNSPESIKSFLYKMQGQGRKARDAVNIAPGKLSKLFNQHHVAGLMEIYPAYAGKTAQQAHELTKKIYENSGVRPGSNKTNLREISGDTRVHLKYAHGGNYKGQVITGSQDEMLYMVNGSIKLNLNRASEAQDASMPLYTFFNQQIKDGGLILPDNPFLRNTLTEADAAKYRAAATKGIKKNYGRMLTDLEVLTESGMTFNAGIGLTPDQFNSQMSKLSKGIKTNYKSVLGGVGAEVGVASLLSYMTGESENLGESLYAGATTLIPDSGAAGSETVDVEGNTYQYDRSTNMVYGMDLGRKVQGLAFKNGQAKLVPYGSLEGRTSVMEDLTNPLKAIGTAIGNTYQRREEEAKNKLSTTTFNQF